MNITPAVRPSLFARIFTAVLVLIASLALSACKSTEGPQPTSSSINQNAGQEQHSLSPETISQAQQLAHDKWWEIEKLPGIAGATTRVFGKQVDKFRESDSGNAKVYGNLLVIDAHRPHDASDGTVFTIDLKTGDAAGALYSETGTTVYVGDYPNRTNVPHVIEDLLRGDGDAPQPFRYESSRRDFAEAQTSQVPSPDGAEVKLIENSPQFAVYRVQELEFARDPSVDKRTCCTDSDDLKSQNDSIYRYRTTLVLLRKAGYIVGGTTQFGGGVPASDGLGGVESNSMVATDIFWLPSKKGLAALGTDIRETVAGHYQNGWAVYKWTLVFGSREFQQIDAATSLADGEKVEFSWHWKPTDLGIADGLTDERQRGVAYLTRSSNGLVVDRIQFDSVGRH